MNTVAVLLGWADDNALFDEVMYPVPLDDPRYPNTLLATKDDLRSSIKKAEERTGFTYSQLAEMARTGEYETFAARFAWVAIGGYRDLLD